MAAGSQSNAARGPTAANSHGSSPPSGLSTQKVLMHQETKRNLNVNSSSSSYIDAIDPVAKNGDNEKTEENGQESPALDIVINNVVCSFNVRCHLNLRDIALRGLNVEYRKENGVSTYIFSHIHFFRSFIPNFITSILTDTRITKFNRW